MKADWRPINTHPLDRPFLAFEPKRELFAGYWLPAKQAVMEHDSLRQHIPNSIHMCWVGGYEFEPEIENPTLWTELPEDPV